MLARHDERTRADSCPATIDQVLAGIETVVAAEDATRVIGVGAPGADRCDDEPSSARRISRNGRTCPAVDRRARFKAPVRVDNDANMAALASGGRAPRQASDFVFLALGAGVGAGVMIGGRLHRAITVPAKSVLTPTSEWQVDFGDRGYLEATSALRQFGLDTHGPCRARGPRRARMRLIMTPRTPATDRRPMLEELAVFLGSAVANIVASSIALVVFGGGLSHAGDLLLGPSRCLSHRA